MKKRPTETILRILGPVILIVSWEVLSRTWLLNPLLVPPFSVVFAETLNMTINFSLEVALLNSLAAITSGYLLAMVVFVSLGILAGYSKTVYGAIEPLVNILRTIPSIVLIPTIIALLGIGLVARIFIVFLACFPPILLNTVDGVRNIPPSLLDTAAVFKIRKARLLTKIIVPAASPQIFTGLRISLAISILIVVAAEMLGSSGGIGFLIMSRQSQLRLAEMYGGLISLGIFGLLTNWLFEQFERGFLGWYAKAKTVVV